MKKIIIFCILLLANISIYSEKVDEKITTNSLGQAIITQTFQNESSGKYKIEWYYKSKDTNENNLVQSIYYCKNSPDYREKQIDSFKNGNITTSVSYFLENNPSGLIQSIETNNIDGNIKKNYYDETEPHGFAVFITYRNTNNKIIKEELFMKKDNKDEEEKEIRYYENDKVRKVEVWLYLENKDHIEKTITYFFDYDNQIIEKQETKYLNSPNYLINSELFCYSDGNMKNQIFYFNIKNPKGYVKMEVKWSESGVLYDKKYYDKAGNEVKPE